MRYALGSPEACSCEPPLDPPDDQPECRDCGAPVQRWGQTCPKCRSDEQEEEQDL